MTNSANEDRIKLIRGGVGNLVVKIVSLGLGLAVSIGLARQLGPDGFGIYAIVLSVLSLLAIPAQFGLPTLVIRETAATQATAEWSLMKGLWASSDAVVLAVAAVLFGLVALVFSVFSDRVPEVYIGTFWLGTLLVPLIALGNLRGGAITGLGHVVLGRLPEGILRPGIFCALILAATFLEWPGKLTSANAMGLHAGAALCAFIIGHGLLVGLRPEPLKSTTKRQYRVRQWVASAVPLGLFGGLHSLSSHTDIIVLGIFQPAGDVGVYRVALAIAALTSFGLAAISMVVAPRIAHLHAVRDFAGIQRLMTASTRYILALSVPVLILLILFGEPILNALYGNEYVVGYVPLIILSLGHLVNAAVGTVGYLLNMTGNENDALVGMAISTASNLTLNFLLIPRYGMVGAAVATCMSMVVWNVTLHFFVRKRLGVNTLAWRN